MKLVHRQTYALWLLCSLFVFVTSCRDPNADNTQPQPDQYLVSATPIGGVITTEQLRTRFADFGPLVGTFLRNNIRVYRIVYKTKNFDNTEVNASGALIVPEGKTAFPLASYQHGTLFDETQAPSYYTPQTESFTVGSLVASLGYIVTCPDYIGYGESKALEHPYEHRQVTAQTCLDMLRASREWLAKPATDGRQATWDNRLFLGGYSQGGGATMATLKLIEETVPNEFRLIAASCGAGAYNKEGFMQDLLNTRTHGIAQYNNLYSWVLRTYNRTYPNLSRPMSYYFREPFATDVQQNGNRANINVSINTAFTDQFRTGVNSGSDAAFLAAVRDNNMYDWKPNTPLQLYHGTADQQVFFRNSQDAFDAMRRRGATNVELIRIEGKDHGPAIQDYLLGTLDFFTTKKG